MTGPCSFIWGDISLGSLSSDIANAEADAIMATVEATPPDSPKKMAHELVHQLPVEHETLQLIGKTRFPRRKDVHRILITGGAGFM